MIKATKFVTPDLEALVYGIAAKVAAAKPGKPGRRSMFYLHEAAVRKGQCPPPLEFQTVNYSYNSHADRIYKLGMAGDATALATMELKGTNTYAKALRKYRDLWVKYLGEKSEIAA